MSMVDDTRKLLQDIVAPDLKALAVRIEALEKAVKTGFDHAEKAAAARSEAIEKSTKQGFELHEKIASARYESVLNRIDHLATISTDNHDALVKALEMDRRVEKLEQSTPAKPRARKARQPRTA